MSPDKVKIDGIEYDASNAPPWYEHWVPGGLKLGKTMKLARENARRNRRGADIGNAILWGILGLWTVAAVTLAAVLWH